MAFDKVRLISNTKKIRIHLGEATLNQFFISGFYLLMWNGGV